MKTYNITFNKNGVIVSDFKVNAANIKEAKQLAQHLKIGFGRVQTHTKLFK